MKKQTKRDTSRAIQAAPPLPPDAPLLSIEDVAQYLRTTATAVRKMLDGRPDGEDRIGELLRSWTVKLSPRRRFVRRDPFLRWLRQGEVATDYFTQFRAPSSIPS